VLITIFPPCPKTVGPSITGKLPHPLLNVFPVSPLAPSSAVTHERAEIVTPSGEGSGGWIYFSTNNQFRSPRALARIMDKRSVGVLGVWYSPLPLSLAILWTTPNFPIGPLSSPYRIPLPDPEPSLREPPRQVTCLFVIRWRIFSPYPAILSSQIPPQRGPHLTRSTFFPILPLASVPAPSGPRLSALVFQVVCALLISPN